MRKIFILSIVFRVEIFSVIEGLSGEAFGGGKKYLNYFIALPAMCGLTTGVVTRNDSYST